MAPPSSGLVRAVSVVGRDDGVHDGQAEARAVILGGKEGIKKLVQQGGRETGAAVVERKRDHAVVPSFAADMDGPLVPIA